MISEREHNMMTTAVIRGAELLDHQVPGWAQDIRLEQLEMHLCANCVLGQLFHEFTNGFEQLGLEGDEVDEHGFDLSAEMMKANQGDVDPLWRTLDALWTDEVKRRVS